MRSQFETFHRLIGRPSQFSQALRGSISSLCEASTKEENQGSSQPRSQLNLSCFVGKVSRNLLSEICLTLIEVIPSFSMLDSILWTEILLLDFAMRLASLSSKASSSIESRITLCPNVFLLSPRICSLVLRMSKLRVVYFGSFSAGDANFLGSLGASLLDTFCFSPWY